MIAHKIVVFLPQDTINHLDRIAYALAKKGQTSPNRSEAVKWLVAGHWKKVQIKHLKKRAEKPDREGLVFSP